MSLSAHATGDLSNGLTPILTDNMVNSSSMKTDWQKLSTYFISRYLGEVGKKKNDESNVKSLQDLYSSEHQSNDENNIPNQWSTDFLNRSNYSTSTSESDNVEEMSNISSGISSFEDTMDTSISTENSSVSSFRETKDENGKEIAFSPKKIDQKALLELNPSTFQGEKIT